MVALPPYCLERLGLKQGDEVVLEIAHKEGAEWVGITIKPLGKERERGENDGEEMV
jgi:bifunctional DNA-binding transcriptional regulator/antitoxin component of YhaV-PrlF toxin-antitoxin module